MKKLLFIILLGITLSSCMEKLKTGDVNSKVVETLQFMDSTQMESFYVITHMRDKLLDIDDDYYFDADKTLVVKYESQPWDLIVGAICFLLLGFLIGLAIMMSVEHNR